MLFQTGPRALLGPTAQVLGGSEPPGTASSDASELAVPGVIPPISSPKCWGVANPLALGTRKWGVRLALRVLMHQNLQCQGVRNRLALRLKIGLTCYLFWGVCAIKPQAETTTSCCLLSGALMCSVCPSSRFTLRPAASFPPVASSADLLRCRRKSVKHGEDILDCQRKWPIMLGSDCSGMGTDVVAAKQLGIEFMVQFATDVDPDCRKVILSHKKGPRSLGYALGCLREV